MLEASVEAGVAYVPGASFFAEDGRPPLPNTMRLNFSYCAPAVIEEGVQRLGRVLAHRLES
jgi:2-aminoadipate transaminase